MIKQISFLFHHLLSSLFTCLQTFSLTIIKLIFYRMSIKRRYYILISTLLISISPVLTLHLRNSLIYTLHYTTITTCYLSACLPPKLFHLYCLCQTDHIYVVWLPFFNPQPIGLWHYRLTEGLYFKKYCSSLYCWTSGLFLCL